MDNTAAADYNYAHFSLAHRTLDHLGGPTVCEAAPDFTADTLDGVRLTLSDFRGRTVVLETGSATCPMYIKDIEAMNALPARFPRAVFLLLYVREAHPGEHLGPHRSLADKIAHAHIVRDEDRERRTILVDDLSGTAHRAYGAMPNTVHVIDPAGTVVYRGMWADPQTLAEVLERLRDGRPLNDLPEQQVLGAPSRPAHERVQQVRDRVLRRAGPQAARDMAAALPHLQLPDDD